MGDCNCIIFLGNASDSNTFSIASSALEILEIQNKILLPCDEIETYYESPLDPKIEKISWGNLKISLKRTRENISESSPPYIIFFSAKHNLAEQFEKIFQIHETVPLCVQKIISIINASFFSSNCSNLLDAMAHFADILLIDNTQKINRETLQAFTIKCNQKECYPLPIKILSKPSAEDCAELLDTQPRRMTLIFDDIDPIDLLDEDMLNQAPFQIPTLAQCDKYLKKDEHGRYCINLDLLP